MLTEKVFEKVEVVSSIVEADFTFSLLEHPLDAEELRAFWCAIRPSISSPNVRSVDVWAHPDYAQEAATAGLLLLVGEVSRKQGKAFRIRTADSLESRFLPGSSSCRVRGLAPT
jgi:hypothetical protein